MSCKVGEIFQAIGKIFDFCKEWFNPENRKKRKLESLRKQLEVLKKRRDAILAGSVDQPEKMGEIVNEIIKVKKEIERLEASS